MPFLSSRAMGAPFPAVPTGRDALVLSLAFLAAYLAIDWLTFIHPRPSLNITPWNPPAGLYMALLLWTGARGVPMVYATLLLADLVVRGHPASIPSLLLANLVIVAGYGAAAHVLRHRAAINPALDRVRDVGWFVGVTFLSAAVVAPAFVGVFILDGALAAAELPMLAFQYWLGDVIGIAMVTPFVLLLYRPGKTPAWSVPETPSPAQTAAIAAALLLVFLPIGDGRFNLFYVLFLPLVWVAVSHGLPGAVMAALVIQSGLIAGLQAIGFPLHTVIYYQTLMLALAITALFLGALVSERRAVEIQLRDHQAELAHIARLAVTGEMASALAHELNQPLLASISYARAAQRILEGSDTPPRAQDLIDKAVIQAERAGEVIRGLRTFLRKGTLQLAPEPAAGIVRETLTLARADASYNRVHLHVDMAEPLPPVLCDRIQIEQVLLNLVHNSIEAIVSADSPVRDVIIRVRSTPPGGLTFGVEDTGPGVAADMIDRLYSPFATTKPAGMGLGLPICRSIVERHGGRLWLDRTSAHGSIFQVFLPAARLDVGPSHERTQ
ncbi:signal transduction histidine kinase [Azospirillum fermentarium]|uniref:sensor histidine kinase n=1 Tax=Azospirillum fermentarium TaxID=1233114 RepID=UPI002225E910|nr:ATP-binding protein [Azospirillum fermentarium]MCW2247708.1 signal transduction histidine kinase [Azospirillum fermentarium]